MCCFSLAGPRSTLCLLTRPALPVLQLQAVYRGVAARKRVLKLLTAGEDIQRFFLMLRQRERFRGMVAASRIIQQGFRVCGEYGEGGGVGGQLRPACGKQVPSALWRCRHSVLGAGRAVVVLRYCVRSSCCEPASHGCASKCWPCTCWPGDF
jgi:hypothetical protein